jgi:hypothetical protein
MNEVQTCVPASNEAYFMDLFTCLSSDEKVTVINKLHAHVTNQKMTEKAMKLFCQLSKTDQTKFIHTNF